MEKSSRVLFWIGVPERSMRQCERREAKACRTDVLMPFRRWASSAITKGGEGEGRGEEKRDALFCGQ